MSGSMLATNPNLYLVFLFDFAVQQLNAVVAAYALKLSRKRKVKKMAKFFVRVELHDVLPSNDIYTTLHSKMIDKSYFRLIEAPGTSSKPYWRLPTGLYEHTSSTQTAKSVVAEVKLIANFVKEPNSVVAVQAADYAFDGLTKSS